MASPKFTRFENVIIHKTDADTIRAMEARKLEDGLVGTVIWCDDSYVARPQQPNEYIYIVHLSDGDRYVTVTESDLSAAGGTRPESDFLGKCYELSYDLVMDDDMDFTEGTFRVPGEFWRVFVFRKGNVPQIEPTHGTARSGITQVTCVIPSAVPLNRACVESTLTAIYNAPTWQEVSGPDSIVLR